MFIFFRMTRLRCALLLAMSCLVAGVQATGLRSDPPHTPQGNPLLLSFIETREHATDTVSNPDMSRRLLVFIQSMQHQYADQGLNVMLVDGSAFSSEDSPGRIINFRWDHELGETALLSGAAARRLVKQFGVRSLPTTFLVNAQGDIQSRWEGLVLPATLARAIGAQTSRRSGRQN